MALPGPETGRVVVNDTATSSLAADARTFAADLGGLLDGSTPAVVTGAPSTAQPGDISITLGNTDSRLGTEGYGISIGPALAISAPTPTGAFWGTRTVLQMLRQKRTLPATTIADWPRYQVRGISLSLDSFPAGWFVNLVRDMSYVKLNTLTTGSALSGLTDAQILQIQQVANQYHVSFVGWFNTTHYNAPPKTPTVPAQFQLRVADTTGKLISSPTTLDITKPDAVKWATDQIEHYMSLQTAPYWHAGGDEYPEYYLRNDKVSAANAPDLYAAAKAKYPNETNPAGAFYDDLFNQIDAMAKSHGKQMWMWNDDLVPTQAVQVNPDVVIDHWINYGLTPQQLINQGHHLINANQNHLYFNEHQPGALNATDADLWTTFDPRVFNGNLTIAADSPNLDGIKLETWHGAMHEAPAALEQDLLTLDRPLAERGWATAKPTTTIATARALFAAIGRSPGVVQTPTAGDLGASSMTGAPALVYLGSQQVFFVVDGQLRRRYWKAGYTAVQEAALATNAPVTGTPVAFVASNQIHVFAIGTDGHVQHVSYDPTTNVWSHDDWTAKSGATAAITANLAGFAYGNQPQHVFAMGTDHQLHHFFFDGSTNAVSTDNWKGDIAGSPIAYAWGKTQNVFAVGTDGALHQWWWQPSDPGPVGAAHLQYRDLGGQFTADARPYGADFGENVQDVVIRDKNDHLQMWSYDQVAGASGWRDLTALTGVSAAGNPLEFVYGTERDIFYRNLANNHLAHLIVHQDGTIGSDDWTTAAIGTPDTVVGDPAGFNFQGAEQHVFGTDPAGKMHHWYWLASDHQVHQDNWPS
ncbi:glycoside hydrolase family 20 zincin-like fold domain-containing protein [Fodinicola feengrottensis]|uniref:glycoside hydrolase family 20 zincin-like fold domain-containing protein n=1 Tax=Fodinicola feengrottensis TaxID=435914 RepID=UPI0036F1C8D6